MGLAKALVRELPETMKALAQGRLSEWRATLVCRETATLSLAHRREADRRLAPLLGALGDRALAGAARRIAAELDAVGVVDRMARAAGSRRVSVRPAPDGMAYLTVLGPLVEVVGAYAALDRHARGVVAGVSVEEAPDGRTRAQVAADIALRLLSGREKGEHQPLEVQLVMTDRALLSGDNEPALVVGHSVLPAAAARAAVGDRRAEVWLRRLYTAPDSRDLVAMDSRRRYFSGSLRHLLVLRDQICRTPWCGAPIRDLDHVTPASGGGLTQSANGEGLCHRCNQVKEQRGWRVQVIRAGPHRTLVTTPTGQRHVSTAPPVLGWGWISRRRGSVIEQVLEQIRSIDGEHLFEITWSGNWPRQPESSGWVRTRRSSRRAEP